MVTKLPYLFVCTLLATSPIFADHECMPTPQVAQCHGQFRPFTGKVAGNKVRLRTAPHRDGPVIRETTLGEMFAIVGETNDFYQVAPPKGSKGYVFRTFILDNTVEGERVNIRLHPDTEAPVIGQLKTGDKVNAQVCSGNSKWLEIALPETAHFYIAREYVENMGPVDMVTKLESRRHESTHKLNAAFLYAQAEMQKPFEEIEVEGMHQKFASLIKDFADFPDIVEKAQEASTLIDELYTQKRIAFLEWKADRSVAAKQVDISNLQKLARHGITEKDDVETLGAVSSLAVGHTAISSDPVISDKILVWQSLEESLYQLWAGDHEGRSMDDFYNEEKLAATILSGTVEPYNRPVKNRPGDFLLRADSLPVAFLYSTKVNLHDLVGKKVTIVASNRPNNNFAFPAYFVLAVE